MNKEKEEIINGITERIKAEHRKHPMLEWERLSAIKIYHQFFDDALKNYPTVSIKLSNFDLIKQHDEDTVFCSVGSHMVSTSTTYSKIIEKGYDIVPDILKYLQNEEMSGMSIIMLLMEITKKSPYKSEHIGSGMYAFSITEAKQAWIQWGKNENLI